MHMEIAVAVFLVVDGEGNNQTFAGVVLAQKIPDHLAGMVEAIRSQLAICIQKNPLVEQQHIMAGDDGLSLFGFRVLVGTLVAAVNGFLMRGKVRPDKLLMLG
jgi:hypothetical protein